MRLRENFRITSAPAALKLSYRRELAEFTRRLYTYARTFARIEIAARKINSDCYIIARDSIAERCSVCHENCRREGISLGAHPPSERGVDLSSSTAMQRDRSRSKNDTLYLD